ncbi:hypothetical protein SAMN04488541_101954 [Thermoflexibacter ruber]|uniref:Uncharacterized protein n=1 Tax=Thermoflexibacter ruber TaxID=1003 RepID=A0A1I2GNQ3_9BACT|nr:hypothetical protein SAMN04488541_101954 [Thermoflexibacter ruber]
MTKLRLLFSDIQDVTKKFEKKQGSSLARTMHYLKREKLSIPI